MTVVKSIKSKTITLDVMTSYGVEEIWKHKKSGAKNRFGKWTMRNLESFLEGRNLELEEESEWGISVVW